MIAAAKVSDVLVLAAVAIGAMLIVATLATFDARIRHRMPSVLAGAGWLGRTGVVTAGLLIIGIALGGSEG